MAVAKKAAATKKAAQSRRVTPRKPVAPPPSEFDKARLKLVKSRKASETVFPWDAYGKTWHVQRPNPALVAAYGDPEFEVGLMEYLTGHLIETERVAFMKALLADPDFDLDVLGLVVNSIEEIVYPDIPLEQ